MQVFVAYGGTFDPVHCGHLAVAHAAGRVFDAVVHLVPAADPPHKGATHAGATERAQMLALAIGDDRCLAIDRRELERVGPSYTVDTLASLRADLGPDTPLVWVIGADSLGQLHRWHRWRELFELGHLLAVGRPGFELDPVRFHAELAVELSSRLELARELQHAPAGGIAVLPLDPPRTESSTEIRRLIARGGPWHSQVPPAVAAYIDRHHLYAAAVAASTPILSDPSGASTP